jgi:hypothetical protein
MVQTKRPFGQHCYLGSTGTGLADALQRRALAAGASVRTLGDSSNWGGGHLVQKAIGSYCARGPAHCTVPWKDRGGSNVYRLRYVDALAYYVTMNDMYNHGTYVRHPSSVDLSLQRYGSQAGARPTSIFGASSRTTTSPSPKTCFNTVLDAATYRFSPTRRHGKVPLACGGAGAPMGSGRVRPRVARVIERSATGAAYSTAGEHVAAPCVWVPW